MTYYQDVSLILIREQYEQHIRNCIVKSCVLYFLKSVVVVWFQTYLKNLPLGKEENLVLRRYSRLRGSEVRTQSRLANHGPWNVKVPFWRMRTSLSHSYKLVVRPQRREGSIPKIGQMGRPRCLFERQALRAMNIAVAMVSSKMWTCCKRKKMREKKFMLVVVMLLVANLVTMKE